MQELYDNGPTHRNTDPITSAIASDDIIATGARATQQRVTFDAVKKFPGSTSMELAAMGGLDRYQLARRLPELERANLVCKGPARMQDSGRPAVTWWPV